MNAREYSLAQVLELFAAFESRRQAEAGKPELLLERLRADSASEHELDQAFLAHVLGGKGRRGPKGDRSLPAKRQQAAFFLAILTERGGLSIKAANGKIADFFGIADRTIAKWMEEERKRAGDGWPAKVAANLAAFEELRPTLMGEPRIAKLLEAAK